MRQIDKLKLTQLSKVELEARQMNALRGGGPNDPSCNCNCSSSSMLSNTRGANAAYGYQYSYGGDGTYTGSCICGCDNEFPMTTTRNKAGNGINPYI